jgi:hypothetical protein
MGYSEMKAEDMMERIVKIITRYGKEIAKFLAGLPQGSPISVILANLATWLKHNVKQGTLDDITIKRSDGYKFEVFDIAEEHIAELERLSEGFSDDNGAYYEGKTTEQLCKSVQDGVTLTGYFSMVTKLGRCAPKSAIDFWNIDPNDAALIKSKTFNSWAWSFDSDSIIKETMPFRVQFRKSPMYWENLSSENLAAVHFLKTQHINLKHLGVVMRTDSTGSEICRELFMIFF